MPRLVAVFGATGTQGRSVVDAMLKDGTFTPRAITRDPSSDAALKFQSRGAEVAKAELSDMASLVKAMRGCEAVFGVTTTFERAILGRPEVEIEYGKNLVDAAKEAAVKFFVFSSLPSITRISGGKYTNAVHFDNKEVIETYLRTSGLTNATIHLGGFLENFWVFGSLKKTDAGFKILVPKGHTHDHQHNWTWVTRDVGAAVLALMKNYDDPSKDISGKMYPVFTACLTYPVLAEWLSKTLGVEVGLGTAPVIPGMKALDDMFAAHAEFASEFQEGATIPNTDLVALGAKFGTIEEFMETEVKSRFGSASA